MSSGVAARVTATRVLDVVLHHGRSLKPTLAAALPTLADTRDRALVEAIVLTALRQRAAFDAAIAAWVGKPFGARDREVRALLHVGFAQLQMGLAAHALVAATVDAARALGRTHQTGLVNAVLRRAQRDGLPQVPATAGWPAWLAMRVRADLGTEAEAVFNASAQPAPMWLRVHRGRCDRDAYLHQLQAAGIAAQAHAWLEDALLLATPQPVAALPGFADGLVSVQDGAAQAVADALDPTVGARVLDACAAPGGKAAHLLERDPSLQLTALDIDAGRVARMREGFARLGVAAHAIAGDAAQPDAWWDGVPFDAILLDAPCSATGIVRRQPDVLLHRRERDLAALQDLQARLLDSAWRMLAPGGVLLYATCSILRAENEAQVQAFLARTPEAQAEPLDARFGHGSGAGRQRLPGEDGMDGFFYARLRKQG
jgi:16S rRNA (cytosine967-C5)-methyltransferase